MLFLLLLLLPRLFLFLLLPLLLPILIFLSSTLLHPPSLPPHVSPPIPPPPSPLFFLHLLILPLFLPSSFASTSFSFPFLLISSLFDFLLLLTFPLSRSFSSHPPPPLPPLLHISSLFLCLPPLFRLLSSSSFASSPDPFPSPLLPNFHLLRPLCLLLSPQLLLFLHFLPSFSSSLLLLLLLLSHSSPSSFITSSSSSLSTLYFLRSPPPPAAPRQCIDLFFDEKYSIEPSWECKFDHVEVRDGPFDFSPIIGRYCGQESPSYVRSTGRYLYIKFVADGELEAIGFSARYNFTEGESLQPQRQG